jgi:hypothetical protein
MADIYSRAFRVLVWLGPAYRGSDGAMAGLSNLESYEESPILLRWLTTLFNLCSRSYWDRLWCLQELKLARVKDVMCGSKVVAWTLFEIWFALLANRNLDRHIFGHGFLHDIRQSAAGRMITLAPESDWIPLSTLLKTTAPLRCEEMRDKAYALLGIASDAWRIKPDYASPTSVFLNQILAYHIEKCPLSSLQDAADLCGELEHMFGIEPGTMFTFPSSANRSPRPGLMYHTLCTRATTVPDMTLLWAIRYNHQSLQETIKMVHRRDSWPSHIVSALCFAGSIAGVAFVSRPSPRNTDIILLIALLLWSFCRWRVFMPNTPVMWTLHIIPTHDYGHPGACG